MITANSYFSGAGIMDLALSQTGIKLLQSFEIDKTCVKTLRHNFSHEINECDITKKLVTPDHDVNCMIGTFPCDHYSDTADIHGTRNGDDLFLHFFRHLVLKSKTLDIFVIENVPGIRKFPVVMEALQQVPQFFVKCFCPVKTDTWLPQKRDRLILIGSKKSFRWRPPEKTYQISLKDILEENPIIDIPPSVYFRLEGKYRDKPIICDPSTDVLAPCCLAHYHKDRSTRLVVDHNFKHSVRPFTPKEYKKLQGISDSFHISGTANQIYKQVGNSVPAPLSNWIGRELHRYFGEKPLDVDPFEFLNDSPNSEDHHFIESDSIFDIKPQQLDIFDFIS